MRRDLPGLTAEARDDPRYRQGYDQGWEDCALAEARAAAARRRASEPPPAAGYGFSATVGLDELAPRVTVERELSSRRGWEFATEVPCCGRRLTACLDDQYGEAQAACCHCGVLYRVGLRDEGDGWDEPSFLAVFEVLQLGLVTARHRRGHGDAGRPARPRQRQESAGRPAAEGALW